MSDHRNAAPSDLRADIRYRTDGTYEVHGIRLRWQIGGNSPDQGTWPPPEDWNDGEADYPHVYEVWINGQARQTVFLYWPTWDWAPSNSHWVDLGEVPDSEYSVKIRAKVDGQFTPFTEEVTVSSGSSRPWSAPKRPRPATTDGGGDAAPRHGTVNHPRSRAAAAIRDEDSSKICVEARNLNTSTVWQEVTPGADRMLADYPWNDELKYLEYRKFFQGATVASTGNPAFRGLDLAPNPALGEWPLTELDTSAHSQTFTYDYMAYHTSESWSHRWFVTREGWDPTSGLAWEDLDPTPFLVEVQGSHNEEESDTWEFATFPQRTGRAALVHIWGGHGGPDTPDGGNGGKTGEFFASTCDVLLS
ncbi:lytic polysaccharide monooxygenase auxiliary activity family 9 protein [Actinacidiphila paucisporea]|uniref:Chitin binding domain-containing protein n=1 Tax=Actinacidiphila paucisporea TaxID=310782 RepID=A0A1M7Q9M9_9ACTN|nr:lytic polysaccharide monooxygenase auxiliary activity family 9 protein [Actinacidiphila paucisporea]SHN27381.1 Chitin binding domain-containing protein [Actinacidiphila paucisporea]